VHFRSSTFPKGDALRDQGRHGAGKLWFVIEQRIIPGGYRSLNSRLQISEPTQLADDLVTDLLDISSVRLPRGVMLLQASTPPFTTSTP
jgi:hypothetical protein